MKGQYDLTGFFRSNAAWFDDVNYFHGFHRCGDFSVSEADFLSYYGRSLNQLSTGIREPQTEQEQALLDVLNGHKQAETFYEKTWLKYLNKTRDIPIVSSVYYCDHSRSYYDSIEEYG
ncbi:DUF413 domain-containing protein [Spartinivicinus poritis]|uniref:Macrodomain Ori protein n=1 Tax=Spartinivicinus poritis TaxID=2994640 RepID=A0ABT5UDX6_9GAMM|nr:DUF413 domain-containing protein [Spartinivicinus sp. A2-2]MDE1464568.1 DUF413 domain-containing protein [Spartinivicinus sp. A2-2]